MLATQIRVQPPDAENRLSGGGHGGQSPRPDRSFGEEAIPTRWGEASSRFSMVSRTFILKKNWTPFFQALESLFMA
jgi:hypothetical protein